MKLTNTDYKAIEMMDSDYLLIKARIFKSNNELDKYKEYLYLSATMNNMDATGELGEYYLNNKQTSLALAYFSIGVNNDNILSLYNLGKLYFEGKKVDKDEELGHYYFSKALDLIELEEDEEKLKYPSLYYSVSLDIMNQSKSIESLMKAYEYLLIAADGYALSLNNSESEKKLKEVTKLINSKEFEDVRHILEHDECDSDECDCGCHCNH